MERKDGGLSWKLVYDCGADPATGKRRQKTETVRGTKKEAELLLAKRLVEVDQGAVAFDRKATVGQWLREWVARYGPTKRPSTAQMRRYDAEHYIIPKIGAVRLSVLKPSHVSTMFLDYSHLARNTQSHIRATLALALDAAVRDGLISRNPCDRVELPPAKEREVEFWTPDQVRAFLDGTRGTAVHIGWVILAFAHVRHAELCALRWEDVDWERSLLRVQRTIATAIDGGEGIGPPKTKSGRRAILLPEAVMAELRNHREEQEKRRVHYGSSWVEGGWILDTGGGRRWSRGGLRQRFLKDVARLGLPRITPKGLRHSGATMMLAAGVHPEIARERLGHSDISVTIGTYSHSMTAMQEATVEQLERMIGLPALTYGSEGAKSDGR